MKFASDRTIPIILPSGKNIYIYWLMVFLKSVLGTPTLTRGKSKVDCFFVAPYALVVHVKKFHSLNSSNPRGGGFYFVFFVCLIFKMEKIIRQILNIGNYNSTYGMFNTLM